MMNHFPTKLHDVNNNTLQIFVAQCGVNQHNFLVLGMLVRSANSDAEVIALTVAVF